MTQQSNGKTYANLIKFGRLLKNHQKANEITDAKPELILHMVDMLDKDLRFTKVEDFFSIFPPIKRYKDDGTWDYKSTIEMRQERLGTHFGKNDFKHLIMNSCYENKYLHLVGLSFMWAISRMHEDRTGGHLFLDFLESQTTWAGN